MELPVYLYSIAMLFLLIINYIFIAGSFGFFGDYNALSIEFAYTMGRTELVNETVNIDTRMDALLEGTETFTLSLTSSGLNDSQNSTTLSILDGNCKLLVLFNFF